MLHVKFARRFADFRTKKKVQIQKMTALRVLPRRVHVPNNWIPVKGYLGRKMWQRNDERYLRDLVWGAYAKTPKNVDF